MVEVEVEDIDDVRVEGIDDGAATRREPPMSPATPARWRKAGKQKRNDATPPATPAAPARADNGDTTVKPATGSRQDGAFLAVLLALLWLFVSEMISLSRATTAVLVEKPTSLATRSLRWCLRPVIAARSCLMSFLSNATRENTEKTN
jgi:hypothetical protein